MYNDLGDAGGDVVRERGATVGSVNTGTKTLCSFARQERHESTNNLIEAGSDVTIFVSGGGAEQTELLDQQFATAVSGATVAAI